MNVVTVRTNPYAMSAHRRLVQTVSDAFWGSDDVPEDWVMSAVAGCLDRPDAAPAGSTAGSTGVWARYVAQTYFRLG